MATNGSVGQHGDDVRLHFENAASHEHLFFFGFAGHLDPNHARANASDQRRVARIDAELARFAGQGDELGVTREDAFLGAHHVDMNRRHYCTFFSNASSIVPTM